MIKLALRYSIGRWAFLAYVLLGVLNLRSRPGWEGEWLWSMSMSSGILVLYGPVAAGFAAAESVRWRRSGAGGLLQDGAFRSHVSRISAHFLCALTGHLAAVLGFYLSACVEQGRFGPFHVELLAPACAFIAGAVVLGATAGWLVPAIITPVAASLGAVALPAATTLDLIYIGGATGSLDGLRYVPLGLVALTAFWLVWTAAGVLVLRDRWWTTATAFALVPLAVWSASVVTGLGGEVLEVDPHGPVPACAGASPRVCVKQGRSSSLGELDGIVRPVTDRLSQIDPSAVPATLYFNVRDPRGEQGLLMSDPRGQAGPRPELTIAMGLINSRLCPAHSGSPEESMLANYLAGAPSSASGAALRPVWERLTRCPT